ncbi:uncharacterized protein LOC116338453 [Contarinia nasturtii]|uniref:uncharacterized protein LOC116338453 n=1 Tax=Contarinia nasturtii TaxID=265458 RepID=UPI0012D3BD54|nr:uncharacterized protein LOC116338453 [Contarinia nasturtii]
MTSQLSNKIDSNLADMFLLVILSIYLSISSAYVNVSHAVSFLHPYFGEYAGNDYKYENLMSRSMPTTTPQPNIPDFDEGDDSCVGKIESIRFLTGPLHGHIRDHITVFKLNTKNFEHHTDVKDLRIPLYLSYKAQSIIRLDISNCKNNEISVKGFTIGFIGNPPAITNFLL